MGEKHSTYYGFLLYDEIWYKKMKASCNSKLFFSMSASVNF